jgi:hypothetical protein
MNSMFAPMTALPHGTRRFAYAYFGYFPALADRGT